MTAIERNRQMPILAKKFSQWISEWRYDNESRFNNVDELNKKFIADRDKWFEEEKIPLWFIQLSKSISK